MGVDVTSDDTKVVATGYGRIAVDFADHVITEITCHARGAVWLHKKKDMTVIDIGGQDTKIIILENGMVKDFAMNDKCSAGTGRFLEVMANTMALRPDALCELARKGKKVKKKNKPRFFANRTAKIRTFLFIFQNFSEVFLFLSQAVLRFVTKSFSSRLSSLGKRVQKYSLSGYKTNIYHSFF